MLIQVSGGSWVDPARVGSVTVEVSDSRFLSDTFDVYVGGDAGSIYIPYATRAEAEAARDALAAAVNAALRPAAGSGSWLTANPPYGEPS